MKNILKCPHSGKTSSKRLLSLAFGIVAIILSFLGVWFTVDTSIIITFATLSLGNQALTKDFQARGSGSSVQ
jgi:hypothetical protein